MHLFELKTQQRFVSEEVSITKNELSSLLDHFRDFLKAYERASQSPQIPRPKPMIEVGSTIWKDIVFVHCYKDQRKLATRVSLSLRFEQKP